MLKMNQALLSRLHDATRQLMANGPVAATAAIQQALGGQAAAQPQPAMRDLNPAPEQSRSTRVAAGPAETLHTHAPAGDARRAPEEPATAAEALQSASVHTAAGAKALVDDMLAKLGALPSGGSMKMPDLSRFSGLANLPDPSNLPGLSGLEALSRTGDLPNLPDLSGLPGLADLPGQRKTRAPAPLPPGAQFIAGVYQGATGTRDYKLYVPASYHGQPMPLLVMLHGCTQDPDDFAAGTRMNALAEEQGLLVVYPAQSRQANQQRCWNWFNALDQQRGQGEPAIIAGIAQQVAAQYAVMPRQVYVAGMSAGGAMAVIAGTLYPDVFAAVGVHSGLPYASAKDLPSALQAMKQGAPAKGRGGHDTGRPIIVFHGDRDPTVHPRNGEQIMSQQLHRHTGASSRRDQGSVPQGRQFTRTTHHHPDGTPLGEHWVVHGAGHAWSGGSADGSYTDARGPDASREMLRFFRTVAA